jgi:GntR family transcriptional regulator
MKPRRQAPLADQIVEIILDRIADGTYPPESQLPSESELADEYDVSRATIRSALAQLSADGAVKRLHGVGTFISKATQIANPLTEVIDYYDLITEQGYEFGFQHLNAEVKQADPEIGRTLRLKEGDRVLRIEKAFTADGDPLIYTLNVIPEWVYRDHVPPEEVLQPDLTEPLFFKFLADRCQQPLDYYIATVRPDIARNLKITGGDLPVDPLLPVLVIEEVGYNKKEVPIIYEVECLFGHRMKFEMIRWLGRSSRDRIDQ